MQSFDTLDDSGHLRIGVLLVRLAPCRFGEVDVEPLCLLRVVVVAGQEGGEIRISDTPAVFRKVSPPPFLTRSVQISRFLAGGLVFLSSPPLPPDLFCAFNSSFRLHMSYELAWAGNVL